MSRRAAVVIYLRTPAAGKKFALSTRRSVDGITAVVRKSKRERDLVVQQCLARCYHSDFPLTSLAQICTELRQAGWERVDAHEVELAVLRVLAGVMGRERESL